MSLGRNPFKFDKGVTVHSGLILAGKHGLESGGRDGSFIWGSYHSPDSE